MDWSLVLASQGIAAVIQHDPAPGGWTLLVEPAQQSVALSAIRQYRIENRRWAWRQQLAWPEVTFHWGVLFWVGALILFHWLAETWGDWLTQVGGMNDRVPATGQWWRTITAVTLHADTGHLAANVATGLVVLGLAMARFGPGWGLLAALLAGMAGNLAGLWLHPAPYLGVGASGMVMGGLGLLAAQSVTLLRQDRRSWRLVVSGALGGFLLFVLLGVNPASDVVAHAGGFVSGVALGAVLALLPEAWLQNHTAERGAVFFVLALVTTAWGFALATNG